MNFDEYKEQVAISSFASEKGSREVFAVISAEKSRAKFSDALDEIYAGLDKTLVRANISMADLVFARLYLSDIENQKTDVRRSALYRRLSNSVVSMIGQRPISGGSVLLLLYFVEGAARERLNREPPAFDAAPWGNRRLFTGRHYSMVWMADYTAREGIDSAEQTTRVLTRINQELVLNNWTMKENLLRTWVYVRDVDNRYQGMVDARREFFAQNGMSKDARFPASTGIEGSAHTPDCLVDMDALAVGGLEEEQIVKMEALEHLSPTIDYGVTFERGIRIRFGDRSHLHISGTASIDKRGEIVHPGDILKQTERTVANIGALLAGQGASIHDLAYIILYLRDPSLFEIVKAHLQTLIPREIPMVSVAASVCRPGWLIEMEGVAIAADNAPYPVFF